MPLDTAREQLAALAAGEVSSVELLDWSIARIEAADGTLNAVVVRDFERARNAASQADAALARGERQPLLGLPITVKESFNVAGLPTTWGIEGTDQIPIHQDSVAVARLKSAGAVLLGKTNVAAQLADWQTFNPVYGVTNNPWNITRTPGGSSGGSAAALAAGYVALEMGSDLNGSMRIPAHCCGVFAHRPTFALTPIRGQAPPGTPMLSVNGNVEFATIGPMARSANDLALALDVLAGPDDAQAVAYKLQLPAPRATRLRDFRVLLLDEHPWGPLSADVHAALSDFAANLGNAGCKIAGSSPLLPDLGTMASTFIKLLMAFFGAGTHQEWLDADRLRLGIAHQWRQLFQAWDVVVCPVWPTPAFAHDHSPFNDRRLDIDGTKLPYQGQAMWCSVAAIAGLPATAMPVALSSEGLPIGVQIVGPYLEDRTTIHFAELAEQAFGGFVPPPGFAD
jgi:amidase